MKHSSSKVGGAWLAVALAASTVGALAGCGGGKGRAADPAGHTSSPAPEVGVGTDIGPASPEPGPPAGPDRPAEFFAPPYQTVGIGQRIAFGVAVIDQDLDETAVTVTAMPATATFDAMTQTVVWTPARADMPKATFTVTIADLAHGTSRTETFAIAVVKPMQPVPTAERKSAVVDDLLLVHDRAALDRVNLEWPLDKMLTSGAALMRNAFKPEAAARLPPLDRKALFDQFLAGLAQTHENPRLDPTAKEFDRITFGDVQAWKIVAFRPRIDKKFHELRIVYQAVRATEPVFAMFRLRLAHDLPDLPPEARTLNNGAFSKLLATHFLDDNLTPKAAFAKDRNLLGKAIAGFVHDLMTFEGTVAGGGTVPDWFSAGFIGIATEARLGGGSRRNPDGTYRSGDGWAWGAEKPLLTPDGLNQQYLDIGIPGFWTRAVPSADKSAWVPACAPPFDPDDQGHRPGYQILCRKALGFVDQPELVGPTVTVARRDAANLFVEHKRGDAVRYLALEDARRDHGEENGMTCAQCHIRNFGVRDYADQATASPGFGEPKALNHAIPTLNFQIVPTTGWEAYTLEFLQDQECKAKLFLEQDLGKPSKLGCALGPAAAAAAPTTK